MTSHQKKEGFDEAYFLRGRVKGFRKDIEICMTRKGRTHAYFPALITCIAFADLLSGLNAGKLEGHGRKHLVQYAAQFMNPAHYDAHRLSILYEMFRHKLAHLGHPYAVFDTGSKPDVFKGSRQRIAWTVQATRRTPPIELVALSTPRVPRTLTPWPVPYDHRIHVSVRTLAADLVRSVRGPAGLLRFVQSDTAAKSRFWKCMETFYPR